MNSNDPVELENILNPDTDDTTVIARWQRKVNEIQTAKVPESMHCSDRVVDPTQQTTTSDRFMANRSSMNMEKSSYELMADNSHTEHTAASRAYANTIDDNMNEDPKNSTHKILAFKQKAPLPDASYQSSLKVLYSQTHNQVQSIIRANRVIPNTPVRILNAPDIMDDYYLNILDWGNNNILAIALNSTVYLWNASNGEITELFTCENGYISSVSWIKEGTDFLAVGTSTNQVQLWDIKKNKRLRSMDGHSARVSSLAWNQHILSSGSRDTTIINHDVRVARHISSVYRGHEQEVSGLAWSLDGKMLASGGNDNIVNLWDLNTSTETSPLFVLNEHKASIKALAWCPYQTKILATGGGYADSTIKLWNTSTGTLLNSTDTGSQVVALKWNPFERELLSAHGFSQNQLTLWKYPSMTKMKDLMSHTARILQLAISPDGTTVCSAGADEKLCFWKVFGTSEKAIETKSLNDANQHSSSMSMMR